MKYLNFIKPLIGQFNLYISNNLGLKEFLQIYINDKILTHFLWILFDFTTFVSGKKYN